ncbi:MAG: class I SAM-dependent methyltransferase [Myxococcota bacterium]|nr:class I SAM-dependent methyltransferase [Myxococcota bacterium]
MERSNVHISLGKGYTHYHRVMSGLVCEYTPKGGSVLDVGCGLGHLLELVERSEPSLVLTGADASEECVTNTLQRVPTARVLQVREDFEDFDKLGEGFDTCIMAHSLEHMLNPVQAVRDVLYRLKPKGHLIVAVPNPVRPTVFFGNVRKQDYVNRGHVYAWDRAHWMNFLERILGLDVVEYASDEVKLFSGRVLRYAPLLKRLEIALARWMPWWSFSHIAVIRKAE